MNETNDSIQVAITTYGVQYGLTGFLDSPKSTRYYVNIPRAVDHCTLFAEWFDKINKEIEHARVEEHMQN